MHVDEIDRSLPSVNFPPPIALRSLVIPENVGKWLRKDQPGMTSYFLAPNCGLNMRWIGGLAEDNDAGWMMICEENYTDIGVYRNNLSVAPCFLKSKGKYLPTRSVRYCFMRGGYNAMAKRFRRYAYDMVLPARCATRLPAARHWRNSWAGGSFPCSRPAPPTSAVWKISSAPSPRPTVHAMASLISKSPIGTPARLWIWPAHGA